MKSAKAAVRMTSVLLDKRDPDGDPQWLVGGNQRVGGGLIQREASRLVFSASVEWQWSLVDYFECLDHDMAIHHFSLRQDLIKKLFGNATFESKPLVAVPGGGCSGCGVNEEQVNAQPTLAVIDSNGCMYQLGQ